MAIHIRRREFVVELSRASTRAFYILVTLLSRPNEAIGKSYLMNQVWLGITVKEGSLRFRVVNLRKVLGDGRNNARYITAASGRVLCGADFARSRFSTGQPAFVACSE